MKRYALILLLLISAGCDQSGAPVEFIVPNGFSGPVWVVEDAQRGRPIPKVGSRYRIEVPENGVVRVSSTQPLRQWHSESARYTDGTPLPVEHGADVPELAVALRGGYGVGLSGSPTASFLAFFVGTKAQGQKFFESPTPPPE
jgi:hypothetical protein